MIAKIAHNNTEYTVDLNQPIDISLPLSNTHLNVAAWYVSPPVMEPVIGVDFVGEVKQGGSVNFRNIQFNPHGHGTHTECVGHISEEIYSVNEHIRTFHFIAHLISIEPVEVDGDYVIAKEQVEKALNGNIPEALIIRTTPNPIQKKTHNYSNTNPPYLTKECAKYIAEIDTKHLLIDLPSVDRELDEGKLLAHRAFWQYPENTRFDASITELVYVPDEIKDGQFLLNLQFASFENDASPSKPVLYQIQE